MNDKEKNDLLFVCSLLEYTARLTHQKIGDLVKLIGKDELRWQLKFADVNHCLTFDETAYELIEKYQIPQGDFDAVRNCSYRVPTKIQIGGVYRRLITNVMKPGDDVVDVLYEVLTSFMSEEISNFNASTFYENQSYLYHSYMAGELLP